MISELIKKTDNELGHLILKLKHKLLEMRFRIANGEVEELHKVSEIKKTIARTMTVLTQRGIKISFTTHAIQLINKDNKINVIKLNEFLDKEFGSVQKINENNDKHQNKNHFNNQNQHNYNNQQNSAKESSNKQPVQIRRTAKG